MIRVDKIIPGGQAIGTMSDGKKIFFWNALPGEVVEEYDIIKQKSNYCEAITTKISETSPFRTTPKDSHFLSTSPWQIIDYDYELKLKQELVVEIFREHHINIDTPKIFTDGNDYYYRNKMEYSLYWNNDTSKINLAFHARGSHRKIPIVSSSIEHPEILQAANDIIANLNSRHEEARKYQSLLLRCNREGEVSGGLYENKKPHPGFRNLTDTILGHKYSYSPNGFFQINLPVYEMALNAIKPHITTDKVLDLYSGVGTIGLSVARDKQLTLVECDKSAYMELAKNVKAVNSSGHKGKIYDFAAEGAERCDIIARLSHRGAPEHSRLLHILDKSENVTKYITPDQTVILDPPRAGCDKKLINHLLEVTPEKIIYLSCNPATQARDAYLLLERYNITDIQTFNFFPHTPHIENLLILSRK